MPNSFIYGKYLMLELLHLLEMATIVLKSINTDVYPKT